MFNRNRKNINFKTDRQSSSRELKKFAATLLVCVLSVLAISCLAILKKYNFDIKSALGGNAETVTETQTVPSGTVEIEGERTYLFWCSDPDGKELRFAWLVNFRLPERRATALSLSTDEPFALSGKTETLDGIFAKSGENQLVRAVEASTGISVDGYIGSTDETFKMMINYFGGMDITVPEQIEYKGTDFSLILVRGKQNLKGDSLFKYLRYLDSQGAHGRSLQASAMLEMLDYVFKPSYLEKRSGIFSKLSNTLKTDLSIVDFSQTEEGVKALMENGFAVKRVADSPQELVANEE